MERVLPWTRTDYDRDREQREIDFLIERDDQALLAIEVKSGSAINKLIKNHAQ